MTRWRWTARCLAALLGVVIGVGTVPAAGADDELEVVVEGGGPLFDLDGVAPGAAGERRLAVTNRGAEAARLSLAVVDVVDDDNGCNRPEVAAGDSTCGGDGGELSRDLHLSLAGASPTSGVDVPARSVRTLTAEALVWPEPVGPGETVELVLGWEFDLASGNETQTDRVAFDVVVSLSMDAAEVAGASTSRQTSTRVAGVQLPRTGSDEVPLAAVGLVLLGVGAMATRLSRLRRAR